MSNPRLFPDLQENGNWYFNSSAAEITNVWLSGFASMCRNMHAVHFNFFLSEMVRLRNEWLMGKLYERSSTKYIGFADL